MHSDVNAVIESTLKLAEYTYIEVPKQPVWTTLYSALCGDEHNRDHHPNKQLSLCECLHKVYVIISSIS